MWASSDHRLKWVFCGCHIDVETRAYVRTASYAPGSTYSILLCEFSLCEESIVRPYICFIFCEDIIVCSVCEESTIYYLCDESIVFLLCEGSTVFLLYGEIIIVSLCLAFISQNYETLSVRFLLL